MAKQRPHVLLRCYGDLFVHSGQMSRCLFSLTLPLYIAAVVQCGFEDWIFGKCAINSFNLLDDNNPLKTEWSLSV